jgi:two-component system response regulator (stage 0 sporulation protein A)
MNIEHDIRTVINVCWITNKDTLEEIAGYPLNYKPTNSEFVDILAYYLKHLDS